MRHGLIPGVVTIGTMRPRGRLYLLERYFYRQSNLRRAGHELQVGFQQVFRREAKMLRTNVVKADRIRLRFFARECLMKCRA